MTKPDYYVDSEYTRRECKSCGLHWDYAPPKECLLCGGPTVVAPRLFHGTPTGYRYGCRCRPCADANTLDIQDRRAAEAATQPASGDLWQLESPLDE